MIVAMSAAVEFEQAAMGRSSHSWGIMWASQKTLCSTSTGLNSAESPNSSDQFHDAISSMAEGCESSALNSRRRKAQ